MANRFFNPNEQFCDPTGLPYAGGSLTFYAAGTTTPLATYSDKALSIPNTNPVVLDSAGRAGSIFLQNLGYKVVLADVNSNVIWTFDNVYTSDFSTVAQFQSGSGSPNGSVAGSAGSSTIPASSYWDFTNNVLYICTQTGTNVTAVWTAINSSSATAVVIPPQGYLTLVSQTPVITSDQTGVSTVYYTPYIGNLIPIYNGTVFTPTVFSEIFCTLVSNHAANTVYDLFVFNNSGTLTLVTGPAWSNSGAGTGARGTGAGTTQLSRINGLWVNTVSMTGRNGSTTYTVPANQGTFVGSIIINSVAGQVSCTVSTGQGRIWGVSNAYNRVPIVLNVSDSTASWTGAFGVRPSRNDTTNRATILSCLPEERAVTSFTQNIQQISPGNVGHIGIGWNSTSGYSPGIVAVTNFGSNAFLSYTGAYTNGPFLGLSFAQCLEDSTGTNIVFNGGTSFLMTAAFRA